jgi:hypothetical protein
LEETRGWGLFAVVSIPSQWLLEASLIVAERMETGRALGQGLDSGDKLGGCRDVERATMPAAPRRICEGMPGAVGLM